MSAPRAVLQHVHRSPAERPGPAPQSPVSTILRHSRPFRCQSRAQSRRGRRLRRAEPTQRDAASRRPCGAHTKRILPTPAPGLDVDRSTLQRQQYMYYSSNHKSPAAACYSARRIRGEAEDADADADADDRAGSDSRKAKSAQSLCAITGGGRHVAAVECIPTPEPSGELLGELMAHGDDWGELLGGHRLYSAGLIGGRSTGVPVGECGDDGRSELIVAMAPDEGREGWRGEGWSLVFGRPACSRLDDGCRWPPARVAAPYTPASLSSAGVNSPCNSTIGTPAALSSDAVHCSIRRSWATVQPARRRAAAVTGRAGKIDGRGRNRERTSVETQQGACRRKVYIRGNGPRASMRRGMEELLLDWLRSAACAHIQQLGTPSVRISSP